MTNSQINPGFAPDADTTPASGFRVLTNVMIPMRDGVRLATDLWIPNGDDPAPTLLARTPYGKDSWGTFGHPLHPSTLAMLAAGYAVVRQDCRGTFASEGVLVPFVSEAADGADTIAWLRQQAWCDGNIGMWGASYLGYVQFAAASDNTTDLRAIAPTITSPDFYRSPFFSEGGAMSWHANQLWAHAMTLAQEQRALAHGSGNLATLMELATAMAAINSVEDISAVPTNARPLLSAHTSWWDEWMVNGGRNDYWHRARIDLQHVETPALHVGGWFDTFVNDTCRAFTEMSSRSNPLDRDQRQQLIIGPWDHLNYEGSYHDQPMGMAAHAFAADVTTAHIRFFDRWIRGKKDALDGASPVRIFVMGLNQWRDEQSWPLTDTAYTNFYLDSTGSADIATGEGVLSPQPAETMTSNLFTYDPADPVPTMGGRIFRAAAMNAVGPVDQQAGEKRDDVLCYTTPVLPEPLEVTGHITLILHVSSSAADTDFTGKLVDVHPDGHAVYLTDGILRARYRNGLDEPEPLEPKKVYEIKVDLSVTSNVFLPGHRIRLEVSSSNFPRFDRNTNTGRTVADDTETDFVVATNSILHGPDHPSRIVLPVIDRPASNG